MKTRKNQWIIREPSIFLPNFFNLLRCDLNFRSMAPQFDLFDKIMNKKKLETVESSDASKTRAKV